MKIQVKAEHILRGKRGSITHCPVALALLEAFSVEAYAVEATPVFLTVVTRRPCGLVPRRIRTPQPVADFMSAFDTQNNWPRVSPFEFEI